MPQSELTQLRAGLAALQNDLEAKDAEAQVAWEAFESARSAAVHGNLPTSDAEQVHREYSYKAAEVAEMRSARDAILGALAGPDVGGRSAQLTPGEKAVAGLGYRELKARHARSWRLRESGRTKIRRASSGSARAQSSCQLRSSSRSSPTGRPSTL